jgi:hypothetical protein
MPATLQFVAPLVAVAASSLVSADVTTLGPFAGTVVDTFDQHSSNMAVQSLTVFGGLGAIENLTDGGAIKVEFASSFNGDLVVPISDMMMGQLGIAQWVFDEPVCRFGGWFENNSGADDATVAFYDADDSLIGEMIAAIPAAAQQWTWNGWTSDVPISRIVVTGNGILNGFLWYENVQADLSCCPTDVDGDGTTGVDDLIAVVLAWNTVDPNADVDGSGVVDVDDLTAVILAWGACE